LLSNAWDNLRTNIESVLKIADAFDEMIISAEVGVAKPDPRIFHYAIERLGVPMGEAVFVDDFTENVEAARSEGLFAIHFQEPDQARRELVRLLDHG
jgi:putative hydrolase of the HAD superfamily